MKNNDNTLLLGILALAGIGAYVYTSKAQAATSATQGGKGGGGRAPQAQIPPTVIEPKKGDNMDAIASMVQSGAGLAGGIIDAIMQGVAGKKAGGA